MAETRMIKTKIWSDDWFSELTVDARYLYLYLLSNKNTHICGYYKTSLKEMEFMTGLTKKRVGEALKELSANVAYIDGWVAIKNYPRYQNVSNNAKVQASIEIELKNVPEHVLKSKSKSKSNSEPIHRSSIGYQDKAQNIEGVDKSGEKGGDNNEHLMKKKYGEFKNVKLSDVEKEKVKARYGNNEAKTLVEELSIYIKSKGRDPYKDHYAVLLGWGKKKGLLVQASDKEPRMVPETVNGVVRFIPNPKYHG